MSYRTAVVGFLGSFAFMSFKYEVSFEVVAWKGYEFP